MSVTLRSHQHSESKHMHGRMDSDDEESGSDDEEIVSEKPDAEVVLQSNIFSSKVGSDSVEVDPKTIPSARFPTAFRIPKMLLMQHLFRLFQKRMSNQSLWLSGCCLTKELTMDSVLR